MKITASELEILAKVVFKRTDKGSVSGEKHDDFIEWANKALDSYDGSGAFELPVLFQGLYRHLQESKHYNPSLDDIVFQAEQKANYKPSEQGPGAEPNIWI